MDFIFVESSNILGVYYNINTAILYLQFKDGSVYEYYDVPEYVYNEFIAAESKGT